MIRKLIRPLIISWLIETAAHKAPNIGYISQKTKIVVKPGENLTQIAKKFHCTVQSLADYNNIPGNRLNSIIPGQILKIPN